MTDVGIEVGMVVGLKEKTITDGQMKTRGI